MAKNVFEVSAEVNDVLATWDIDSWIDEDLHGVFKRFGEALRSSSGIARRERTFSSELVGLVFCLFPRIG